MNSHSKIPLVVIIPTYNEEVNLTRCLESVIWADKILIVDAFSSDRTVDIAKRLGGEICQHEWQGYSQQKNWVLDNLPLQHKWVLFLDADEVVTEKLEAEIQEKILHPGPEVVGYYVNRRMIFLGRWLKHCWWYPDRTLRLFKRGLGRFEERSVHERVVLKGQVGYLKNDLIHENRKNLHEYLNRLNRYSTLEALERYEMEVKRQGQEDFTASFFGDWGQRRRALKLKIWYRLPFRPLIRFLWMYFVRLGFLDGKEGFIFTVLASTYEFHIDSKYYELKTRGESHYQEVAEKTKGWIRTSQGRQSPIKEERSQDQTNWMSQLNQRTINTVNKYYNSNGQKQNQIIYFDDKGLLEPEIMRPHNFGRLYGFLIDCKMQKMAGLVEESLEGKNVLNICCGSGMEAEYFANLGARVTGLDISLGAVKGARIRSKRFDFELKILVADAESLPFKPESFDFVFTHDGLHHLPHPEKGIAEMVRVAKRGIFFTEPADAFITKLAVKLGLSANHEESGNLVQRLNVSRLKALFDQLGLSSSRFLRYGMWYAHYPPKWFRLFENEFLFGLFKAFFHLGNSIVGRFGNKMVAAAWKKQNWNKNCATRS